MQDLNQEGLRTLGALQKEHTTQLSAQKQEISNLERSNVELKSLILKLRKHPLTQAEQEAAEHPRSPLRKDPSAQNLANSTVMAVDGEEFGQLRKSMDELESKVSQIPISNYDQFFNVKQSMYKISVNEKQIIAFKMKMEECLEKSRDLQSQITKTNERLDPGGEHQEQHATEMEEVRQAIMRGQRDLAGSIDDNFQKLIKSLKKKDQQFQHSLKKLIKKFDA